MALWFYNDPLGYARPSRLLDQHFGLDLEPEDLIAPIVPQEFRSLLRCPAGYLRPWRSQASAQDVGSTVKFDKDKFEANLDVQQFKPEEVTVKVSGDNVVTVEGKHEEKQDDHGFISRHFVRKYVLPKGHDTSKIESKLSSDGVLTITAPRVDVAIEGDRSVPITHTGAPAKAVEDKGEKKEIKN